MCLQCQKILLSPLLAQEWKHDLMTRPDISIKVERKPHDMRILGGLWECNAPSNPCNHRLGGILTPLSICVIKSQKLV